MLMPHDIPPPVRDRAGHPTRMIAGLTGLLLTIAACSMMQDGGLLAMLVLVYLTGLTIVLKALLAPATA